VKSIYQQELTGDLVKRTLKLAAPLAREAWERTGKDPDLAAFTDTKAADVRGLPVWEMERWAAF